MCLSVITLTIETSTHLLPSLKFISFSVAQKFQLNTQCAFRRAFSKMNPSIVIVLMYAGYMVMCADAQDTYLDALQNSHNNEFGA